MSLKDAVLEIADRIDSEFAEGAEQLIDDRASRALLLGMVRSFVQQLRVACKAAADPPPVMGVMGQRFEDLIVTKEGFRARDQAAERLAIEKRKAEAQEAFEGRSVVCMDGPDEDVSLNVPPGMPVGARIRVPGTANVYELRVTPRGGQALYHVPAKAGV